MDRSKIMKMLVILAAIVVIASSLSKLASRDSLSLSDYAALHGIPTADSGKDGQEQAPSMTEASTPSDMEEEDISSSEPEDKESISLLTGASLNGSSCFDQRVTFADSFYYEPVSEKLQRYMIGVSYPSAGENDIELQAISFEELRYMHILHYDFDGNPTEGELICNIYIAQDLIEIFYELYRNEYKLEKVLLIDEYDGNEAASAEDNNSFCFLYSRQEDSHTSKHAQGLAIDINPLYNPCVIYTQDGSEHITPASSSAYADRSFHFPYKIDEEDLCYKLFTRHGFTWGGNWNDAKSFQHFQKAPADN